MSAPTIDDVIKAVTAVQEARGEGYAQLYVERFGGEGAGVESLTEDQRTELVKCYRAEKRTAVGEDGLGVIPKAHHLCTDLANANRIVRNFGSGLRSVDGVFYSWTGTHWECDDSRAHQHVANLSEIVGKEAAKAEGELDALSKESGSVGAALNALKHPRKSALATTPDGVRLLEAQEKAKALRVWSSQCEMDHVQGAALRQLRNMLTLEYSKLDTDPWLFNCLNGTIDLRTGAIKAHEPKDYITRCAPVRYDKNALAPIFVRYVREILGADEAVYRFLQRWLGYSCTGVVRERKLLIHLGPGGNGKSTLIDTVSSILGDYASTAAPGLLADKGHGADRHPTEIADLRGRRLVTAHEADESATLREGFVKQATGGDRLKGRRMHGDFFEFDPTHKLQLLTNYKPTIVGQDRGIWHRILLLNYPIEFGSQEEIDSGKHPGMRLKDEKLSEKLLAEREGIFAWLIQGAVEWHNKGLKPPDAVLAASLSYKEEQDRIGLYIKERCELDPKAEAVIGTLYADYKYWCKENTFNPQSSQKLLQSLEHSVPGYRREDRKVKNATGRRTTVRLVTGLRLNNDGSDEEFDAIDEAPAIQEPKPSADVPDAVPIAETPKPVEPETPVPSEWDDTAQRDALMAQLKGLSKEEAAQLVSDGFSTVEKIAAVSWGRVLPSNPQRGQHFNKLAKQVRDQRSVS